MKIGILTSSRADFGIYLPLIRSLNDDSFFELTIIAFGTHSSPYHGETLSEIKNAGFEKIDIIQSLLVNDNPNGISTSYGITTSKFADYWSNNSFDLIFCLGDRYEMSAAVQAGIPFNLKFAHIHGGETTLGAIDNIYRHQITLASSLHFASTESNKQKIIKLTDENKNVYNVGSLSLEGLEKFNFLEENKFRELYSIPTNSFILTTFHTETINIQNIERSALNIKKVILTMSKEFYFVVTMPNNDTYGKKFRNVFEELNNEIPNHIRLIESFGKYHYFNAMRYADFLFGNTSSGIIEAASLGKYVINVGDRQKGRERSENVIDCSFETNEIINAFNKVKQLGSFNGINIYRKLNTTQTIIEILKNKYATL